MQHICQKGQEHSYKRLAEDSLLLLGSGAEGQHAGAQALGSTMEE